jgi:hypothetical protein
MLAAAVAGAASAAPRESFTFTPPIDSRSTLDGTGNTSGANQNGTNPGVTITRTFTGGYTARRVFLTGTLTPVNTETFRSEARIRVVPPTPAAPFIIQPFAATATEAGLTAPTTIDAGFNVALAGAGFDPVGQWQFQFFERWQDSAPPDADAQWTSLTLTFDDALPAPTVFARDFGTLTTSPTVTNTTFTAGQIKWYKFTIAQDILGQGPTHRFLDINTNGSTVGTGVDTEIGIYNANGTLIATDDDSGDGPGGANSSQVSFGYGRRPAVGTSQPAAGQDGDLVAGTYYMAIGGWNVTYGAGFSPTTTSTATGSFRVNISIGVDTGTYTAGPTTGVLTDLGTLNGNTFREDPNFAPAQVNWYKFVVPADATAASGKYVDIDTIGSNLPASVAGETDNDTIITLFYDFGTPFALDDDGGSATAGGPSALTFGATTPTRPATNGSGLVNDGRDGKLLAGTYYLAVCTFGTDIPVLGADFQCEPDGGHSGTLHVNFNTNFGTTGGGGCNAADITNLGGQGAPDGQLTVDDLIKYLNWFLTGDIRADLTNLGGQGAADGQLTADDLIKYLNLFLTGTGC